MYDCLFCGCLGRGDGYMRSTVVSLARARDGTFCRTSEALSGTLAQEAPPDVRNGAILLPGHYRYQ